MIFTSSLSAAYVVEAKSENRAIRAAQVVSINFMGELCAFPV
jgi:hypothetical protein